VLFAGLRKEALAKYVSAMRQLGLVISSIEYSAFSVLRLAKLAGVGGKGIVGFVSVGLPEEEDEINFTVLENDFPLFSRDMSLGGTSAEQGQSQEEGMFLEKMKTELRVSLDFYNRKFAGKNITKIFFISSSELRYDLESFIKEMGVTAQFIDAVKYIGSPVPFTLSLVKSYGCSLSGAVKLGLNLDLLTARAEQVKPKQPEVAFDAISFFGNIRIDAP
jgi:Tfp pilus assembly PilM family ATPase